MKMFKKSIYNDTPNFDTLNDNIFNTPFNVDEPPQYSVTKCAMCGDYVQSGYSHFCDKRTRGTEPSGTLHKCQFCGEHWTHTHTCTVQRPAPQQQAPTPDTQIKLLELKVRLLELRAQLLDKPQFAELISALEAEIAQFTPKAAHHVG